MSQNPFTDPVVQRVDAAIDASLSEQQRRRFLINVTAKFADLRSGSVADTLRTLLIREQVSSSTYRDDHADEWARADSDLTQNLGAGRLGRASVFLGRAYMALSIMDNDPDPPFGAVRELADRALQHALEEQ
jgi:hypothetical protein